ncbi:CBO0543 family protein [uncultured Metabacillus sp.]|uniref:CBO0543 family protein n=1 Tax=uncultured Metabacillus sp. TaxID=2860135 RepID=UPI00261453E9|nr:CBO0543 family protein [uncultured Metabacillus sp.]
MEKVILWILLILGIVLFLNSLRKPPIKHWILIYLLASYFSIFLGVLVVEEKMLKYPVQFFDKYFSSSILYEYLLFPVVCIYFYQTTFHSKFLGIIRQAFLYTAALTLTEIMLEKYTDLIEYLTWTWLHTFISIYLLMLTLRFAAHLINKEW